MVVVVVVAAAAVLVVTVLVLVLVLGDPQNVLSRGGSRNLRKGAPFLPFSFPSFPSFPSPPFLLSPPFLYPSLPFALEAGPLKPARRLGERCSGVRGEFGAL